MIVKPKHDFKPCVPGAFRGGLARTEFFDGMVLSEADMKREQGYWQMKRRLTNLALGQGTVWGLTIEWDAKARCFTVCPGYGLSCCGDDLVVECPETVCEGDLIDVCSEEFRRLLAKRDDPCDRDHSDGPVRACLMLEYVECPEEPRQVFEDPCAEKPHGCRFGAVRETVRLRLVPPPPPPEPGPVERFCEKIRKLLDEAGINPPDLFPAQTAPHCVTSIAGFSAAGAPLGGVRGAVATAPGDSANLVRPADGAKSFRLGFEPATGWIFTHVTRDGVEATIADILMGVFATASDAELNTKITTKIVINMIPLFGGADGLSVNYSVTAGRDPTGVVTLSATVASMERIKHRPNCTSLLADGLIGNGDPACTVRTLALAVLTGWFRGLLGSPDCNGDKGFKATPMEETLAWIIAWLAWRVIWGIDITKQGQAGAEKCLRLLFEEWCCGFHYKGPHCGCDAHGIILGCVEISTKGRVLCFDEWAHRRYVLTGPLITHWMGQFGLAPIDVMATRLAGWICCVAKAPLPLKPDFDFANAISAYLPLGNAGLGLGQGFGSAQVFNGVPVMPQASVLGPLDFVAQILREIGRGEGPRLATATSIRRITMQGSDLSLLEPVEIRQFVDQSASPLFQAIRREVDGAPPMARTPIADFVRALAAEVAVTDLQPAADNPLVAPLARVLETAGVRTVGDLIEVGPEPALARARPGLALDAAFADRSATDKAMALLYGAALSIVSKAAAAVAEAANARPADDPFIRADLADQAMLAASRRVTAAHIQGRGLSAQALRDIAARVIDARP